MHIYHKQDVHSPLVTEHGEIIYELIGRQVGETTERHSVAFVVLPPGKSSRLHYHPETEESYFVLRGQARMILGEEEAIVQPGQIVLIQAPKPHKIINIGEEDLEFLAFCVPAWEPTNTDWLEDEQAEE
jgi:mannose-6-phosphate isomerase-like protein (cupin superfamily)